MNEPIIALFVYGKRWLSCREYSGVSVGGVGAVMKHCTEKHIS